jgi:thiosulfate/3-mercaptopyruvate sulfurtransferase
MSTTSTQSELLVSTDWVDEHRHDENLRIVESDEDLLLYQQGHIREAVRIDWQTDLQDQTIRDYLSKDSFAELCASKGISNDTTVWFSTATRTTGGRATRFGRSSCTVTKSA